MNNVKFLIKHTINFLVYGYVFLALMGWALKLLGLN